MSMISRCPRCAEWVLIPEGVVAESPVRCPLCAAEYPLADALAAMPPALVKVEPLEATGVCTKPIEGATVDSELAEPVAICAEPVEAGNTEVRLAEAGTTDAEPIGVMQIELVPIEDVALQVETVEAAAVSPQPIAASPMADMQTAPEAAVAQTAADFDFLADDSQEEIILSDNPVEETAPGDSDIMLDFSDLEAEPADPTPLADTQTEPENAAEQPAGFDFLQEDSQAEIVLTDNPADEAASSDSHIMLNFSDLEAEPAAPAGFAETSEHADQSPVVLSPLEGELSPLDDELSPLHEEITPLQDEFLPLELDAELPLDSIEQAESESDSELEFDLRPTPEQPAGAALPDDELSPLEQDSESTFDAIAQAESESDSGLEFDLQPAPEQPAAAAPLKSGKLPPPLPKHAEPPPVPTDKPAATQASPRPTAKPAATKASPPKAPAPRSASTYDVDAISAALFRSRRRQRNPIVFVLGIALFGLLGIAAAYYGLNYLGGKQFDLLHVYLPGCPHTYSDGSKGDGKAPGPKAPADGLAGKSDSQPGNQPPPSDGSTPWTPKPAGRR